MLSSIHRVKGVFTPESIIKFISRAQIHILSLTHTHTPMPEIWPVSLSGGAWNLDFGDVSHTKKKSVVFVCIITIIGSDC